MSSGRVPVPLRNEGPHPIIEIMISQTGATTNPRRTPGWVRSTLGSLIILTLLASCSGSSNPVDPNDRLCGGEAGLGARIEGRSQPLAFCVDDGDVSVLLTASDRYDIAAQLNTPRGVFQIRMVFALRSDFPVSLVPVATIAEATADPGKVWIYYVEIPNSGNAIESLETSGGSFRLTFSDENVLAGTLENIALTMHDVSSGDTVGTRKLAEGFFSLSVKSPTAAAIARVASNGT